MIGTRPHGPGWDELFPWSDAVVELTPDGSDTDERLDELDADPAAQRRIGRANMCGVLDRHDIAHRVRWLLETVGAPVPDLVGQRLTALRERVRQLG